ncbi:hypothetical protein K3555_13235 [Leisingera sp. M527]|uniref:hypothetical protein n=1 Tax=Leisingera sp. M527 TaxID=2867014 RepID=UPI0021A82B5E|nr:hypothetical protein [Leisingera sp. M527]UWQ31559.1 hypothetical protein K3555_13235 [Leisingera sp. M527]
MTAVIAIWMAFGAVWLIGFYYLARFKWYRLAQALVLLWGLMLIWLSQDRFHENHDHGAAFTLYFDGHLVYGLCAFIGWKLGRQKRWRSKLKSSFRRFAGAFPGRNRWRS